MAVSHSAINKNSCKSICLGWVVTFPGTIAQKKCPIPARFIISVPKFKNYIFRATLTIAALFQHF